MKSFFRSIVIDASALAFLPHLFAGFQINGGIGSYLLAGLVLSLMAMTIKPILNLLTLPLNMITLGTFSFITNAIIFYILTVLVPQVTIVPFLFPGLTFAGFVIPKIFFGTFLAYVICAFTFSVIITAIKWLIE